MDELAEEKLREMFRRFNKWMLFMWRIFPASWFSYWPPITGNIMVLHHIGHKSGLKRRTPLNFAIVDNEVYCTAGFGAKAHWYKNIMANPEVKLWLPDGQWEGVAEEVDSADKERQLFIMRQVLIGSGFAAFAAGMNPYQMSDEELETTTAPYRLIHIRRTKNITLTDADIPGDLMWIWLYVSLFLLLLLWFRPKRKG